MGTPEFAVESLRCLVEGGYKVVGVVTMPDKPAGRGHKIQYSPVKQYALEQGLPLLQPEKLKDEAFLEALRAWKADLQIVVAFRMLPEVVWNMPRLGTFNLHASLLPQYRGAAPINWAVINGETETGITTFFLRHEIDTGEIIQQVRIPIADTDNVGVVHDKLMELGGQLVVDTVDRILADDIRIAHYPFRGHVRDDVITVFMEKVDIQGQPFSQGREVESDIELPCLFPCEVLIGQIAFGSAAYIGTEIIAEIIAVPASIECKIWETGADCIASDKSVRKPYLQEVDPGRIVSDKIFVRYDPAY